MLLSRRTSLCKPRACPFRPLRAGDNNTGNYTATQPDGKTTTSVTVYGTADNIKAVSADDIMVYIDMSDAQPGLQTFDLQIDQPENGLVRYELLEDTYELNVIGDTTQDTQTEGDTNNG